MIDSLEIADSITGILFESQNRSEEEVTADFEES